MSIAIYNISYQKLLELKRNVGNHYEDFLICDDDIYFAQCIYKFLQHMKNSKQNLLLEIQSFNNTEALLDVVKTDSEIADFFGYYFYRKQKLME